MKITKHGPYLPGIDEEVVGIVDAIILNDKTALHLRANDDYVDVFKKQRKAGEEWLVTPDLTNSYIPGTNSQFICCLFSNKCQKFHEFNPLKFYTSHWSFNCLSRVETQVM